MAIGWRVFHADACSANLWQRKARGAGYFPRRFRAFETRAFAGCSGRIACYTAASRLPALVRRSEPQETAMTDDKNKPASGFQYSVANLKPVESSKIALTFPDGAKR